MKFNYSARYLYARVNNNIDSSLNTKGKMVLRLATHPLSELNYIFIYKRRNNYEKHDNQHNNT